LIEKVAPKWAKLNALIDAQGAKAMLARRKAG
jgi:hypothetical protein